MRREPNILGIFLFFAFFLLIDFYVFSGLKALTTTLEPRTRKIVHWAYWIISVSALLGLSSMFAFFSSKTGFPRWYMGVMAFWALIFVPKLVFILFLIGEDIYRLIRSFFALGNNAMSDGEKMTIFESRRKFIATIATAAAAIPFLGILHGITLGKFKFRVKKETIYFPDLPEAFDGFTITQISDVHVGSFDPENDREEIKQAIALANAQNSDLLVFTGDLVNNRHDEMDPWMDVFSKLKGKEGQFSILGNHDYGYYLPWSEQERKYSFDRLCEIHGEIGFNLLRNEHHVFERGGEKLYLLGVEDWGRGFLEEGKIEDALKGVPADAFKVLLSHDPSHFDEIISSHPTQIHLTLSGHTHGAQFGVEIPGIKWSPVQMRYSRWAGLYETAKRYIYVNRGFGFLGFPGRVGIWPEITVLELKRGTQRTGD
jgi:uncharacterized protein